jgi:hypothetical protein
LGNLKHVIEDFRSIFVNSYKDGVESTVQGPMKVFYLDPNNYKDPDEAKNIARLRADLEKQQPGVTGKPGDAGYLSDEDAKSLIELSLNQGPFAVRGEVNGKPVGIVNLQDKAIDHKNELVPMLTGVPLEKLVRIPGSDYQWDKAVGIHEGAHLNQFVIDPNWTPDERLKKVMERESMSDRAVLDYFESINRPDMAQAWKDYRAIGAGMTNDPDHATGIFLNDKGPIVVTDAHALAASTFKNKMDVAVATELGISQYDASELLKNDPKKYMEIVDRQLKEGTLGTESPEMKQYMEQFAGAYRRQVIEKENEKPLPKIQHRGPRADLQLPEGVEWQDTPGYTRWAELNMPNQDIWGQDAPVALAENKEAEAEIIELAAFAQPPTVADQGVALAELDETTLPSQAYGLQGTNHEIRQMLQDYGHSIGHDLGDVAITNGPHVENLAGYDFQAQPPGTGPAMKTPGIG